MRLTRDSAALWFAAGIAAATYLSVLPPPTEWSYAQWMQAVAGAGMWLSGKLATSPLPGEHD